MTLRVCIWPGRKAVSPRRLSCVLHGVFLSGTDQRDSAMSVSAGDKATAAYMWSYSTILRMELRLPGKTLSRFTMLPRRRDVL